MLAHLLKYLNLKVTTVTMAQLPNGFLSIGELANSLIMTDGSNFKLSAYGTISYLPAAFGGVCASVVIRDLLGTPIQMHQRPDESRRKQKEKAKKQQRGIAKKNE